MQLSSLPPTPASDRELRTCQVESFTLLTLLPGLNVTHAGQLRAVGPHPEPRWQGPPSLGRQELD